MQMILRSIWGILIATSWTSLAEYCGNNRIPFGIEVHKDGHLALLCSRPNCHEKKYAECPERAEEKSCSSNTSWVGAARAIRLFISFSNLHLCIKVIVRRGEFFEAEERYDKNDEDVIYFDLITNIRRGVDDKGEYYSLTIHRYHCGRIPDTPPNWYLRKNWPFWQGVLPY
ncbi:unnamed protein product [Heligmosomoides polygyrus]|uniref:Uncharacterized protein n=1 Tax=Heligmosomoides polygyrus TaxID=6339 RepID=A0A3P8D055_HELPZ|nr:unnamed protein product [Heligmosomoides polygyrus]